MWADHPTRRIRVVVDAVVADLDGVFDEMYSAKGRPLGGGEGYDTDGFVADVRDAGFTPHVAQNVTNRRSLIVHTMGALPPTAATRCRNGGGNGVEEPFGWVKTRRRWSQVHQPRRCARPSLCQRSHSR